ncbi:MAG TPA: SGNH/GDSL hydrolase family protein [Opitutaceae bacterium]|nr:SGNH/GDSL hydrolase family protein [Opitutaceae bacterium]
MTIRRLPASFLCAVLLALALPGAGAAETWTGSWFASQQLTEPSNLPPAPGVAHATLRQFVFPTLGGTKLRVTFSNVFGESPLVITAAHIAVAGPAGQIDPATDHALQFEGKPGVTLQAGASFVSDPLDLPVTALKPLAVTITIDQAPKAVTGHPGSRSTSYFCPGDYLAAAELPHATKAEHWYFLSAIEVVNAPNAAAVVAFGDSITDGHGSTTDANNRWPDDLARQLQSNPATAHIAVLNAGIGGNRLLRNGLGPNALARFDRDVLAPPGVRWMIVLEGINDIGTRLGAQRHGFPYASADEMIAAYDQLILRAHAHGIHVIGATITPYEGAGFYFSADGEADRQKVNTWIRTSGHFDAVVDFDAIVRDPKNPTHLAPAYDSGDHLHPSVAGYETMANAVYTEVFAAQKP